MIEKHGRSGTFALHSRIIPGAAALTDDVLRKEATHAYKDILNQVTARQHRPLRFWNHVPHLNTAATLNRNRYMIFNAGRYDAFSSFYGSPTKFDTELATASAVGSPTDDLVIYCLSTDSQTKPVNNPRQVAPYHYSQRFGPLPPCFARAVRLTIPENLLIVGGTAAIRGEDSVYREDLVRQMNETLTNMTALIRAALGNTNSPDLDSSRELRSYRHIRVYFPNAEHEQMILSRIRQAFANVQQVERMVTDLCRPELLVEIEGVAELPA